MATAESILPVDDLKVQLRLPGTDDMQNTLLAQLAEAGLAEIQNRTGLAILDRSVDINTPISAVRSDSFMLTIPLDGPAALTAAKWAYPNGRIDEITPISATVMPWRADEYGRGEYRVRPEPDGIWPNYVEYASNIITTYRVGMTSVPQPLIQAAVLIARDLYDNTNSRYVNESLDRIIAPYVGRGGLIIA